jgi:hypothetical protein
MNMLGYCGINCDECGAYKGTVNTDMALLQQFIAQYCSNCQIRTCAIERNLPNCAACPDFENCSRLHDFIKGESEEIALRMQLLRGRYLEHSG